MAKAKKFQIPGNPYASKITYADVGTFQAIFNKFPSDVAIKTEADILKWVQEVYKNAHGGNEHGSLKIEEIIKDTLKDNATPTGKIGRIAPPSNKDILDGIKGKTALFLDFLQQYEFREYAAKNIVIKETYTSIRPEEYDKHVEEVKKLGYSLVQAKWLVYDYVRFKTGTEEECIRVDIKDYEEEAANLQKRKCVCGVFNNKDAAVCSACQKQLKCPKCGNFDTIANNVCLRKECGFDLNDMLEALETVKKAKIALASDDIDEAKIAEAWQCFKKINLLWRECPGADDVERSINTARKEWEKVRGKIDTIEKEVRIALGQRHLYEVQSLILKLREIPQAKSYLVEEEKSVNKNLADVRAKLAQLPALSDIAKKIDICEEIIAIAADCKEAQDALVKYPPLPPSNLSAKVNAAGSVDLTWKSPAARRMPTFVVVRKIGAVPASTTDGQTLTDNISNTTYTDSQCETGVIYGYAVFTKRDKVCEQTGCRSQLVQRIGELTDIEVLPADGSVTFSWSKPANCQGIQITRYQKSSSAQGTKLPQQHGTVFMDSGLGNGADYTYLFQTVFQTAEGKSVTTAGIKRSVTPQLPPPAILDLKNTDTADGMTTLQWTPPSFGEVLLYNVASVPDIPLSRTEANTPPELEGKYGNPIPVSKPKQGQTQYKNAITGVRYIVPFTVHNGLATIGKSVTLLRVQDVTNLKARISGTRLFISWDWPQGQEKVLLAYRHDKQPEGVDDQNATRRTVTKQDYDQEKAIILPAESMRDFYIKVYSIVSHNGSEIPSAGVGAQTGVSEIHWKFIVQHKYRFFGAVTDAKIQVERRDGKEIPDLIIRKEKDRKPLRRDRGEFVMEIQRSSERVVSVDFDAGQFANNHRFQIFVKDENSAGRYALYGQSDEIFKSIVQQKTFKDFVFELLFHPIRFLQQLRS